MGSSEHEIVDAHGRGEIENGCSGVFAHRVNRLHTTAAFGTEFEHERHNGVGFGIVLPARATEGSWATGIVNGDLFDKENAERCLSQLCLIKGKAEDRSNAAGGNHDFLSFIQTRLHDGRKIRRYHLSDLLRNHHTRYTEPHHSLDMTVAID